VLPQEIWFYPRVIPDLQQAAPAFDLPAFDSGNDLEHSAQEYTEGPSKKPKLHSEGADAYPPQDYGTAKVRRGMKTPLDQLAANGGHICDDNWKEITQLLDAETQQRLALSSVRLMKVADAVRMNHRRHDEIRVEGLASAHWYMLYYTEEFVPPERLSLHVELQAQSADEPEFNMINAGTLIERILNLGTKITHIVLDGLSHKSQYELWQCGEIDVPEQIDQAGNLHPDFEEMLLLPSEWIDRKCIGPAFVRVLQMLHQSLVDLRLINVGISSHVLDDLVLLPPAQIASAEASCSGVLTNPCFAGLVMDRLLTEDDVAGVIGGRVHLASVNDVMERCAGFAQLQKLGLNYNATAISQETMDRIFTLPNLWSLSIRHSSVENDTLDFTGALNTDHLYTLTLDNTSAINLVNLGRFNKLYNISAHRVQREFLRMLRAQANSNCTLKVSPRRRGNAKRLVHQIEEVSM
jgi:hypothetical protein